jgi:hypothetical protein
MPPSTSHRSSTPSGLSALSTLSKSPSTSSELIEDRAVRHKEGYFEAHKNRESVADVSYAIVKRSSLPHKQGGNDETRGSKESAQDSRSAKTKPKKLPESGGSLSSKRTASTTRRPPPKSPSQAHIDNTYESIDEILLRKAERGHKKLTQRDSFSPPLPAREDTDTPPPLPDRPAPKTHPLIKTANSSSSPNLLEPAPYEGLKDKDVHLHLAAPRVREPVYDEIPAQLMKKVPPRLRRDYEEVILPDLDGDAPRLWVPPAKRDSPEQVDSSGDVTSPLAGEKKDEGKDEGKEKISILPSKGRVVSRLSSNTGTANISLEDLRENWAPKTNPGMVLNDPPSPLFRRRQAKSFSAKTKSLMYKRNSSARSLSFKASTLESTNSVSGVLCR